MVISSLFAVVWLFFVLLDPHACVAHVRLWGPLFWCILLLLVSFILVYPVEVFYWTGCV